MSSLFGSLFGQQEVKSSLFSSAWKQKDTAPVNPPPASQQSDQQPASGVKEKKRKASASATLPTDIAQPQEQTRKKRKGKAASNASDSSDEEDVPSKQQQQQRQQKQKQQQQQQQEQQQRQRKKTKKGQPANVQEEPGTVQGEVREDGGGSHSSSEGDSEGGEDELKADGQAGGKRQDKERKHLTPEQHAEQLQRTIFVGNVPAKMPLKTLKAFFSKYGEVASARLRNVPVDLKSKMPKRAAIMKNKVDDTRAPAVAYVVFKEAASVQAALAANMCELGGNHVRVDRAAPPAKAAASTAQASHQFDTSRSLFVGNLHFATLDEELIQFFTCPEALEGNSELAPAANGGLPAVEGVRIVRDPATSLNKGFGFVLFRTKAAVRAALSLNGRPLRKRPLRLTRVSVQQQQKLQVQRAAAAGANTKGPRQQQQQQPQPGGSRKGALHQTTGGGVRKGPKASGAGEPALWQGTQVKGKAKGVRGTKAVRQQGPAGKQSGGATGSTKRSGKRPAVAAKKKKQLASKAQKKHKQQ